MPTRLLVLISFALMATTTTGCATSAKKAVEPAQATANQMTDLQNQVNSLNYKVGDLENKNAALTEKLDGTRLQLDNLLAVQRPVNSPVSPHPADSNGLEVTPEQAQTDPHSGFENDEATRTYRRAITLFQSQKYADAIMEYTTFLEKFPDHPLAGSAQYYIGQCYFLQKDYKLAVQEFQKVLTSYDRSPKVAETLRKLAESEDALGEPNQAVRYRQQLTSLFPQSPAAAGMAPPQAPAAVPAKSNSPAPAATEATSASAAPATASTNAKPLPTQGLDSPPPPTAPLTEEVKKSK